ncbi:DUF4760 domain-containing protein [Sandarakinorhabdus sp.]|uniref:DUF4760 domain-containing protein n=1 Tax=Sandarakinorhabdus sp. TaxID=1916663 RepID=UPI00286D9C87|nr:DUF4760 domain-containing protein [Sandarakinorhabdus sp.]
MLGRFFSGAILTLDEIIRIAPVVSTGAIVASALVAASVFWYTRRANLRRATLDMVMKTFLDDEGQKKYRKFKEIVKKSQNSEDSFCLSSLKDLTEENAEDRATVLFQLNSYELVALGIRRGIFDEMFYKLWFHGQFTKDYDGVRKLIDSIQTDRPSMYCEFKYLNDRWVRSKHPIASPSRFRQAWWALTGQRNRLDSAFRSIDFSTGAPVIRPGG